MIDFTWFIITAGIVGTIANIYKRQWCFLIWLCTNSYLIGHNLIRHDYPQATLFAVYVLLAVWGLARWSKGKEPV